MRLKLACFFSAVLLAVPCVAQNGLNYTAIPDVPGNTSGNRANGINPVGDIVGHYNDSTGLRHGYLFAKESAGPTTASSTGRCNTFYSVNAAILPWKKRSAWLSPVKT